MKKQIIFKPRSLGWSEMTIKEQEKYMKEQQALMDLQQGKILPSEYIKIINELSGK